MTGLHTIASQPAEPEHGPASGQCCSPGVAEFAVTPARVKGRIRGRAVAALTTTWSRNRWTLMDQALVSAMNFLTTAALARMLGVYWFGIYSVLYIVLQYLNTLQLAVVVNPMMSLAPQLNQHEERSFLRGMAGFQYLFSLACCLAVAAYMLAGRATIIPARFRVPAALPFLLTVFCFQLQDWYRRFCYVRERTRTAFWNDVISYVGQIAILVLLWATGRMALSPAYYAIAVTSFAAFLVGYLSTELRTTAGEIRRAAQRSWPVGRGLLVTSQFQWLGSQGIYLIIAGITGVASASGIRAVIALMGPVNVLYQLLDNVIPVRAARIYAAADSGALLVYLRQAGWKLAVLVGIPMLAVSLFARPILVLVFGRAYGAFASLVAWEAAYLLLGLVYRGLLYYNRTLGTMLTLARSAIVVAALSVPLCFVLTKAYGVSGGMAALVAGQLLNVALPLSAAFTKYPLGSSCT